MLGLGDVVSVLSWSVRRLVDIFFSFSGFARNVIVFSNEV